MSLQDLKMLTDSGSAVQLVIKPSDLMEAAKALAREIYDRGFLDGMRERAKQLEVKTYSQKEAAAIVGRSERTLRNWEQAGICKPNRVGGAVTYTSEQIAYMKGLTGM